MLSPCGLTVVERHDQADGKSPALGASGPAGCWKTTPPTRSPGQVTVLDRGRVIATGSPAELKAKVGGDHLELTVPDPNQRQAARALLGPRAEPPSAAEPQILRIPLHAEGEVPVALLAELARCGVQVSDLQVHRPTLEDVFLHLTGQPLPSGPASTRGRRR